MPLLPVIENSNTLSRRGFLGACAGCAACSVCPSSASAAPEEKARVRLVFTHPPKDLEGWPYVNYNYEPRKQEVLKRLTAALPGVEFLPLTVMKQEEAKALLENDADIDGYLCYMMGIPSARAARILMDAGRRVVVVDDLYGGTGEFLPTYAYARRQKLKVAGVSSARFQDVIDTTRVFAVQRKLRSSTILDVCDRRDSTLPKAITDAFGVQIRTTSSEEINAAYKSAGQAEAEKWAKTWIAGAKKVVEPKRDEIVRSGLMYVAMRQLMADTKAQAIDIDCLRMFYGKKLPAYPCLGFFQLNNDGLVGACEADLNSTISMLAMTYLTNRPGYISDPVIDTSKNQIIYAHCVAPTKMYGPNGKSNPYHIRDHSEDRKGAVVQSFMPLGEMTTTIMLSAPRKEMVIHQGRSVANIEEDRACRSKLAVEVKDVHKLLGEWDRWGWHRVTFYGDLRQTFEAFAALSGFQTVAEG
ncbi:MAG: hypothetical protein HY822_04970 [Acidobacteria bacterium]|nr:hypothetical protein [Acidobacteriota bacterium]